MEKNRRFLGKFSLRFFMVFARFLLVLPGISAISKIMKFWAK
jgi:hypothetical protein